MKTSLIATLSLVLFSCAGIPPKMEHPIKLWNGSPEFGGICRNSRSEIAAMAKRMLKTDSAKDHVNDMVKAAFAKDKADCIDAKDPNFAKYGAFSFEDIRVLLRYQEDLIYSCEKWKQ